jgi:hypothetical protein
MAINLGGWSWAANLALDWGAPALAAAFGIPGPVSSYAIGALKRALGLAPNATEEQVKSAVDADPETARVAFDQAQSEVTAKYAYLTRLAEIAGANAADVNKTMQKELGKVSWWHWRHLSGYIMPAFGLEFLTLAPLVVMGKITAADMVAIIGALTPVAAIYAALQGVILNDTSALKTTAVTGKATPGIVSTALTAIKGKR